MAHTEVYAFRQLSEIVVISLMLYCVCCYYWFSL